jgi:crotonobetainyl-CoA:carnitine CoA-transferase CaiB-like acyl-CoA transferase
MQSPPLEGVRILDLTWYLPYTTILADFGAEVIKVEPPKRGDPARRIPPLVEGESIYFINVNRNKKSVTLNLRMEKGREILYRLSKTADVIIESFRPSVAKRLGIDYESIKSVNPRMIYVSVTGYGQAGPYRDFPGHDINYISIAGILDSTGQYGSPPIIPGVQIADLNGCLLATIAILIALRARDKTGKGQFIDLSLTHGVIWWLTHLAPAYFATGKPPERGGTFLTGYYPFYNVYETKDGKYISLGCLEEHFWRNLCKALGKEDLAEYQWATGEKREEIFRQLREAFKAKTRDEWFKELVEADVPVAPVYSLDEVFKDPQILSRRVVEKISHPRIGKVKVLSTPIELSETPGKVKEPAPALGQHTKEILKSLGYSDEEIKDLEEAGVI